jgi:hypothetical protein
MPNWLKKNQSELDEHIEKLHVELRTYSPQDPEYENALHNMELLIKLRASERRNPISKDMMLSSATYFLGLLLIVAYEQKHAVTSKGLGLLRKPTA